MSDGIREVLPDSLVSMLIVCCEFSGNILSYKEGCYRYVSSSMLVGTSGEERGAGWDLIFDSQVRGHGEERRGIGESKFAYPINLLFRHTYNWVPETGRHIVYQPNTNILNKII
jgi:hypothetical protein